MQRKLNLTQVICLRIGKTLLGVFKVITPKNPLLSTTSGYKYKKSYQIFWPILKCQPTVEPLPQYPIGLVL